MTAKIKLNAASGGGSFSLQAPSSSSNNRVFTIPDVADGTIATTATAGKILQVIQDTKTDTQSIQSQSFVDVSGLSVTITPSATTSKIRIFYAISFCTVNYAQFRLQRNGSDIFLGDAGNNIIQSTFTGAVMNQYEMQ